MIFEQFYLECLSHASYLVGDQTTGNAIVVDPQRDIDQYLDRARELNLTITHVLETHFHADFLSGHLELAKALAQPFVSAQKLARSLQLTFLQTANELSLVMLSLKRD
jgi:glyoxylase-like metal-dependent hydrolase (beta-lactamase superfamily II)